MLWDTALYDGYGAKLRDTDAFTGGAETVRDAMGFQGEWGAYTDTETGLVLMGHRYYDAGTGRFLTRDPIGYNGGINLYGFTGNNPVNENDPNGFAGGTVVGNPVPDPLDPEKVRITEQLAKGISRFLFQRAATSLLRAAAFNPVTLSGVLLFGSQTRLADDSLGPGSPYAAEQARKRRNRDSRTGTYGRPFHFRAGVQDKVWQQAVDSSPDGEVRDPTTGTIIQKDNWVMGHKPGWEFRKHVESARRRGIDREQFLEEYNNPDHYRPELRGPNSSRKSEASDSVNYWP